MPRIERNLQDLFVHQYDGDPDGQNGNCGYASSLMALRKLGLPDPPPAPWARGGDDYRKAMTLRELGGGGRRDDWGECDHVRAGLEAAGARAEFVRENWGRETERAVELMRDEFRDRRQEEAFILCGTHDRAPSGHFVAVVDNPRGDEFTVLDPLDRTPMTLRAAELARFLRASNATDRDEVIRVSIPNE